MYFQGIITGSLELQQTRPGSFILISGFNSNTQLIRSIKRKIKSSQQLASKEHHIGFAFRNNRIGLFGFGNESYSADCERRMIRLEASSEWDLIAWECWDFLTAVVTATADVYKIDVQFDKLSGEDAGLFDVPVFPLVAHLDMFISRFKPNQTG